MLRVTNVDKAFAGQEIFRKANWFVGPGDRVALVGANGTGKSTLLRIVAQRESADAGRVEMPKGLRVGYLAQADFVLDERTVREEAHRAFDEVLDLQTEIRTIEARLEGAGVELGELTRLSVRQGEILDRLQVLGVHDIQRQIHAVLTGLGFHESEFDHPLATLSGGWQMRAALARILLQRPQLLLLDEPTNHLDLEAREWLESYLRDYPYAFVLVSHDRYFLDVTAKRISEITALHLEEYTGNFAAYEKEREKRIALRRKAYERQQEEIRRIQRFIDRFRSQKRKASQVQSRIRMLEKMERHLPPDPGRRSIVIPRPPSPRSGRVVLELREVAKAYGDLVVFESADLRILRGSRVALVGPNGAGKSTLMRLLAKEEPPDEGECRDGHNVQPVFFAQDHTARIAGTQTVLEAITSIAPNDFVPQVRSLLGAFLFSGEAVDKRVSVLSGGERNRLALAMLLVRPSNLMLLDEPTNHLDIASKDVLLETLRGYPGTIVFVSHDRHFLSALADHVIEVGGGLREYPGTYDAYLWRRNRANAPLHEGDARKSAAASARSDAAHATPPVREVRRRFTAGERKRERRTAELEARIAELEDRKRRFSEVMSSPDFFTNRAKSDLYLSQMKEVETDLEELYRQWESLHG
jgi:ATP-binding cassette subfamily F protein 3